MKEYYGEVSLSALIKFYLKAKNEDEATEIVFEDIEGLDIILKDGSKLEVNEIEWDLIRNTSAGNVAERNITDFWIEEE